MSNDNPFDISHLKAIAQECITMALYEWTRPCVVFKPRLTRDGNMWIACLGDNLQEGVIGTGESPEKAMADFDVAWRRVVKTDRGTDWAN